MDENFAISKHAALGQIPGTDKAFSLLVVREQVDFWVECRLRLIVKNVDFPFFAQARK